MTLQPGRILKKVLDAAGAAAAPWPFLTDIKLESKDRRWKVEGWSVAGKAAAVRVGDLVFLDGSVADTPPGALTVGDLPGSVLADEIGPYTACAIAALEQGGLEGARVVDLGAGDGILSMAALRFGAARADLVEYDPKYVAIARASLRANGWSEGRDFNLVDGDMVHAARVCARLPAWNGRTVVIANIGNWPGSYPVSAPDAMNFLLHLEDVDAYMAGGYKTLTVKDPEDLAPDRALLRLLGMREEEHVTTAWMPDGSRRVTFIARASGTKVRRDAFLTKLYERRRDHTARWKLEQEAAREKKKGV